MAAYETRVNIVQFPVRPPPYQNRFATVRSAGHSSDILDAIGNTPLLELDGVFVKCEFMNPSGSIKARIAKYIIERAESCGAIKPGDTIVEATSGNTGNAFAMVAAAKGYRMVVVMPEGLSSERVAISRAYGAEVVFCGNFHVNEALEHARKLGQRPGFFFPGQFESEWNVEENRESLGREILWQLPGGRIPDAFVHGVGTGGTLVGVGQAFRQVNPNVRLFAVEPAESRTLAHGEIGLHRIEGISDGFIPDIVSRYRHVIDQTLNVSSADAVTEMRTLARTRGLLCGPSSGAHLLAAKRIRDEFPQLRTVVTVLDDKGEKYLQDFFMGSKPSSSVQAS